MFLNFNIFNVVKRFVKSACKLLGFSCVVGVMDKQRHAYCIVGAFTADCPCGCSRLL
nr:MAG TPA: hypothetical protein [Caudoviricetes sp.]